MKEFEGPTRRGVVAAILSCALLSGIRTAAAAPGRLDPQSWIDQQQELSDALATGQIQPVNWCEEVEALSRQIDLGALLAAASAAAAEAKEAEAGSAPRKRIVRFADASGRVQRLGFTTSLLEFQPQTLIPPRAHRNMVSAHLVLDGKVRIRTFDRLREDKNALVIKPAEDFLAEAGLITTMCPARHDVHWFVPQDGPATMLEIAMDGLSSKGARAEITPIDPLGGRVLKDGSIVAPVMSFDAAAAKYTAEL